jgi:CXXX repeat modification system protein
MRKLIGKVTIDEKEEILSLFERKNGLIELFKLVEPNSPLYEKIVVDMGTTSTKSQQWWNDMSIKYSWEGIPEGHWEIDFNTCDIYLVD